MIMSISRKSSTSNNVPRPARRGISSMPIDSATAFTCLADRQSVTAAVRDHQTSDNKRMVVLKSATVAADIT